MKKTLALLSAAVLTATISFGYPNVRFKNSTPNAINVEVTYSGCKSDKFSVPAVGVATPAANRGACLITKVSASVAGAKIYTSTGTSYSNFTLIKHENGAMHVHRTDDAFVPQDMDASCGVATTPPPAK